MIGREIAQSLQTKSAEQIMQSSPSMGSNSNKPKDEFEMIKENGMAALESAKGYFSMFASKVKESNVASDIKSAAMKAKDYSIDAASKAKDYSIKAKDYSVDAASKAKNYSYEKSASIQ